MDPRRRRIFRWVFGTHAGVLFLLLAVPFVRGCFHRKPKEVVMEIGIAAPAPHAIDPILPSIQPEPEPEPAPEPEPEPAPQPKPKPKPKPDPKPKKPKRKPVEPQFERRITRRIDTPQPQPRTQPRPDLSELKESLGSLVDPDDAYYGRIQPRFYAVWQQPASAPYGTRATATIRVNSGGQVTYSALKAPSGNPVFDRSVRAALRAIGRLPAPPKSLVNRNILIYFELD